MDRLDRPILITGTPRSGKSCIGNILSRAPEFASLAEPLMLWEVARTGRDNDRRTAAEATSKVRSRIRGACAAAVAAAGRRRYLDNLAYHAIAIPFIRAVLPEAKIVHVVRSPSTAIPEMIFGWAYRDTVWKAAVRRHRGLRLSSLPQQLLRFGANYVRSRLYGRRSSWGPRVPGLSDLGSSAGVAELAAHQWEQMVRIARSDLADLPQGSWIEVRLEQVLEDPSAEMARIAEFAEVEDIQAIVDYAANFIEPDRVFEKTVKPTAEQWSAIWRRLGPLAEELGYAAPDEVKQLEAQGG